MIETERLLLRGWRPADAGPFAALDVAAALPVERIEAHWREHGFGLYAIEIKDGGAFAGLAGLSIPSFLPAVLGAVEVGWHLLPEHRGRGYATEAGRASLAHAFGALGLRQVVAIVDPGNAASLRVARRLGMTRGRDRIHPVSRARLAVYERSAPARDRPAERQPERVQAEQRQRGGVADGVQRTLVDPGEA